MEGDVPVSRPLMASDLLHYLKRLPHGSAPYTPVYLESGEPAEIVWMDRSGRLIISKEQQPRPVEAVQQHAKGATG